MKKLKEIFKSEKFKTFSKKVFTKKKIAAAIAIVLLIAGIKVGYSEFFEARGGRNNIAAQANGFRRQDSRGNFDGRRQSGDYGSNTQRKGRNGVQAPNGDYGQNNGAPAQNNGATQNNGPAQNNGSAPSNGPTQNGGSADGTSGASLNKAPVNRN